ncbi:hypothetical protein V8C86DRAFT_3128278 [Haematococcus lacustris]
MWLGVGAALLEAGCSLARQASSPVDLWEVVAALLREHPAAVPSARQAALLDTLQQAAAALPPTARHRPGQGPGPRVVLRRLLPPAAPLQPHWVRTWVSMKDSKPGQGGGGLQHGAGVAAAKGSRGEGRAGPGRSTECGQQGLGAQLMVCRGAVVTLTGGEGQAVGVKAEAATISPFIFDASVARRQQQAARAGSMLECAPEWVVGLECCVEVEVHNPLEVPLHLAAVHLQASFTPAPALHPASTGHTKSHLTSVTLSPQIPAPVTPGSQACGGDAAEEGGGVGGGAGGGEGWQPLQHQVLLPPRGRRLLQLCGRPLQAGRLTLEGVRLALGGATWLQPLQPPPGPDLFPSFVPSWPGGSRAELRAEGRGGGGLGGGGQRAGREDRKLKEAGDGKAGKAGGGGRSQNQGHGRGRGAQPGQQWLQPEVAVLPAMPLLRAVLHGPGLKVCSPTEDDVHPSSSAPSTSSSSSSASHHTAAMPPPRHVGPQAAPSAGPDSGQVPNAPLAAARPPSPQHLTGGAGRLPSTQPAADTASLHRINQAGPLQVWEGQVAQWSLSLTNISHLVVGACQVSVVNSKGVPVRAPEGGQLPAAFAGALLQVEEAALAAALPLAPGASVTLGVALHTGRIPHDTLRDVHLEVRVTYAGLPPPSCLSPSLAPDLSTACSMEQAVVVRGRCLALPVALRLQRGLAIGPLSFSDYYAPVRDGLRCTTPALTAVPLGPDPALLSSSLQRGSLPLATRGPPATLSRLKPGLPAQPQAMLAPAPAPALPPTPQECDSLDAAIAPELLAHLVAAARKLPAALPTSRLGPHHAAGCAQGPPGARAGSGQASPDADPCQAPSPQPRSLGPGKVQVGAGRGWSCADHDLEGQEGEGAGSEAGEPDADLPLAPATLGSSSSGAGAEGGRHSRQASVAPAVAKLPEPSEAAAGLGAAAVEGAGAVGSGGVLVPPAWHQLRLVRDCVLSATLNNTTDCYMRVWLGRLPAAAAAAAAAPATEPDQGPAGSLQRGAAGGRGGRLQAGAGVGLMQAAESASQLAATRPAGLPPRAAAQPQQPGGATASGAHLALAWGAGPAAWGGGGGQGAAGTQLDSWLVGLQGKAGVESDRFILGPGGSVRLSACLQQQLPGPHCCTPLAAEGLRGVAAGQGAKQPTAHVCQGTTAAAGFAARGAAGAAAAAGDATGTAAGAAAAAEARAAGGPGSSSAPARPEALVVEPDRMAAAEALCASWAVFWCHISGSAAQEAGGGEGLEWEEQQQQQEEVQALVQAQSRVRGVVRLSAVDVARAMTLAAAAILQPPPVTFAITAFSSPAAASAAGTPGLTEPSHQHPPASPQLPLPTVEGDSCPGLLTAPPRYPTSCSPRIKNMAPLLAPHPPALRAGTSAAATLQEPQQGARAAVGGVGEVWGIQVEVGAELPLQVSAAAGPHCSSPLHLEYSLGVVALKPGQGGAGAEPGPGPGPGPGPRAGPRAEAGVVLGSCPSSSRVGSRSLEDGAVAAGPEAAADSFHTHGVLASGMTQRLHVGLMPGGVQASSLVLVFTQPGLFQLQVREVWGQQLQLQGHPAPHAQVHAPSQMPSQSQQRRGVWEQGRGGEEGLEQQLAEVVAQGWPHRAPIDLYASSQTRSRRQPQRSSGQLSDALTESQLYSALACCSAGSSTNSSRSTSLHGSEASSMFDAVEDQQQQLSQLPEPKALLHDLVLEAQQVTGKAHRPADSTLAAAVAPRKPPEAPRSSQAATQPAASEPGPSTPPSAQRSKRTKAKPAAEPTQPTKGRGKAKGKAAKVKKPGRFFR